MTDRSLEAGPKLEYIIRAINAILEQSFPPRNSIEKQGCCVLLWQGAVLVGQPSGPTFQAEISPHWDRAAIATAEQSRAGPSRMTERSLELGLNLSI